VHGVPDAWEAADVFDVLPSSPYPEFSADDAMAAGTVLADFGYEVEG
jgi:hypothetical protein